MEPSRPQPPEGGEQPPRPRFSLGQAVATPGTLEALGQANQETSELLFRHVTGDWGDLEYEEDRQENELSVGQGFRILSVYNLPTGRKVWVITEADRSATTFLLPEEY